MPLTAQEHAVRDQMVRDLDQRCAALYARRAAFAPEHALQEQEAQAYKDAGYPPGAAGRLVAAYASRAGIPPAQAADNILARAAADRAAWLDLGEARARRHELRNLPAMPAIQAAFAAAWSAVKAVEDAIGAPD